MDNQKITPLWESNSEYPVLRRPGSINSDTSNNVSVTDIAKTSTLSVEAKEWYPPGYKCSSTPSMAPTNSVQDRLRKFKPNTRDSLESEMDKLNESIKILTIKPGKFEQVSSTMLESLEPHFNNVDFISKVASSIFQQALKEPNFQYSGARLCAVLNEHCPVLRGCLHTLCEKELLMEHNLPVLTMLIAEIYSQMSFELFGQSLIKALKQLLMTPTEENVKHMCQALKLTGAKLETLDEKVIQELVEQLDSISPQLPSHLQKLIQSVKKLAKSKWGQEESQSIPPPAEPCTWSDGPVFYGPDGLELSLEETEFLAEYLDDLLIDDSDPDALWNPEPEMSDEIQAAFKEFVQSGNR